MGTGYSALSTTAVVVGINLVSDVRTASIEFESEGANLAAAVANDAFTAFLAAAAGVNVVCASVFEKFTGLYAETANCTLADVEICVIVEKEFDRASTKVLPVGVIMEVITAFLSVATDVQIECTTVFEEVTGINFETANPASAEVGVNVKNEFDTVSTEVLPIGVIVNVFVFTVFLAVATDAQVVCISVFEEVPGLNVETANRESEEVEVGVNIENESDTESTEVFTVIVIVEVLVRTVAADVVVVVRVSIDVVHRNELGEVVGEEETNFVAVTKTISAQILPPGTADVQAVVCPFFEETRVVCAFKTVVSFVFEEATAVCTVEAVISPVSEEATAVCAVKVVFSPIFEEAPAVFAVMAVVSTVFEEVKAVCAVMAVVSPFAKEATADCAVLRVLTNSLSTLDVTVAADDEAVDNNFLKKLQLAKLTI